MAEKKFYWLKLKEDFFEEDTIQWLEEQENGKDYCLFYLKLCLKSLKTNGILIRNVGQMLIPYDVKKLADITNTTVDTAIVAMEVFKKIGLVQVLENGEIYMTQLENMVGSESKWAQKKRNQRAKDKREDNVPQLSQKSPREIEIEIRDKEIEIRDKEIEIDNKSSVVVSNIEVFKYFEQCGFIMSAKLMDFIVADIEIYGPQWLMDAADTCVKRGKLNNYGYLKGILQNWQTEGRKEDTDGTTSKPTENTKSEEPQYKFDF